MSIKGLHVTRLFEQWLSTHGTDNPAGDAKAELAKMLSERLQGAEAGLTVDELISLGVSPAAARKLAELGEDKDKISASALQKWASQTGLSWTSFGPDTQMGSTRFARVLAPETGVGRGLRSPAVHKTAAPSPTPSVPTAEQREMMAACLAYHFMSDQVSHDDIVATLAENNFSLPHEDLAQLGVTWSQIAAARGRDKAVGDFNVADATAWAKTEAGRAYLQRYRDALEQGLMIPPPPQLGALEPARLDGELRLFGEHAISGELDGKPRQGTLTMRGDHTYRLVERAVDGTETAEEGTVGYHQGYLVLESVTGARHAFERQDTEEAVHFVCETPNGRIVWKLPGQQETTWDLVTRVLSQVRVANYLFRRNQGVVDDRGGRKILRSRQPNPALLKSLRGQGLKTVISLNGQQDKQMTLWVERTTFGGENESTEWVPRTVVLEDYIQELGLKHYVFDLGASRVVTEQELVDIFRLLLDPSLQPALLHCTGGADRTGVIAALYQIEFYGVSKDEALQEMREHAWASHEDTWIQGAFLRAYRPGTLTRLLTRHGIEIPQALRRHDPSTAR